MEQLRESIFLHTSKSIAVGELEGINIPIDQLERIYIPIDVLIKSIFPYTS